jgi:arylsulfatase
MDHLKSLPVKTKGELPVIPVDEPAFEVWREPFVELRVPLFFNLRRDPFEKAQHNSNTYNDWVLDRVFLIGPAVDIAAKFLLTMKDYPPSATAGSFNLTKMQKQIEGMSTSK